MFSSLNLLVWSQLCLLTTLIIQVHMLQKQRNTSTQSDSTAGRTLICAAGTLDVCRDTTAAPNKYSEGHAMIMNFLPRVTPPVRGAVGARSRSRARGDRGWNGP